MADKLAGKDTIIGPETHVSGEIRGDEDLVVRGRVDGKVALSRDFTVDTGGIVQADVEARNIVVSGVLVGNATATDSVRLTDKARVVGNLSGPRIIIEAGAAYRGRVEMGVASAARPAEKRQASEKPAAVLAAKQPPRMLAPPRTAAVVTSAPRLPSVAAAATNGSRVAVPSARVVSAPQRPSAPPSLPRPDATAMGVASSSGSGPGWAKKKLRRR